MIRYSDAFDSAIYVYCCCAQSPSGIAANEKYCIFAFCQISRNSKLNAVCCNCCTNSCTLWSLIGHIRFSSSVGNRNQYNLVTLCEADTCDSYFLTQCETAWHRNRCDRVFCCKKSHRTQCPLVVLDLQNNLYLALVESVRNGELSTTCCHLCIYVDSLTILRNEPKSLTCSKTCALDSNLGTNLS